MSRLVDPQTAIARLRLAAILYATLLAATLVWLALDPRALPNGESVALKPVKFALSLGVHFATLAVLGVWTRRLEASDRWFAIGAHIQIAAALVEIVAIVLQGARGVPSHFNVGTPLDAAIFTIMGLGVAALTIGFLIMLIGLFLHRAGQPMARLAFALAIFGVLIGSATGVAMVSPTPEQAAQIAEGARPAVVGAYGVGAAKQAASLPFFGWSFETGDWRAPHFIGIHALQALPLLAYLILASPMPAIARAPIFASLTTLYFGALSWSVVLTMSGRSILSIRSDSLASAAAIAALALAAGALVWRDSANAAARRPT